MKCYLDTISKIVIASIQSCDLLHVLILMSDLHQGSKGLVEQLSKFYVKSKRCRINNLSYKIAFSFLYQRPDYLTNCLRGYTKNK